MLRVEGIENLGFRMVIMDVDNVFDVGINSFVVVLVLLKEVNELWYLWLIYILGRGVVNLLN